MMKKANLLIMAFATSMGGEANRQQTQNWEHAARDERQKFWSWNQKISDYMTTGKRAYVEKWGEWFFIHVQNAFKELHGDNSEPFGKAKAETPAEHAAQDDLVYKPNV